MTETTPTDECIAKGSARQQRPLLRRHATLTASVLSQIPREVRHLVSGGLAGMLAKTVVAPIDRIKILYQVSPLIFRLRSVPGMALSIVRLEGVTALWRGNSAMMLRVFPYSGIQFMVFDKCKSHFRSRHDPGQPGLTKIESFMAGSIAGVVSVIATYPLDLTRAQLAVHYKKKGGERPRFRTVLWKNYFQNGIFGLFRGITPTILGILPYSGVAFTINEQCRKEIKIVTGRDPSTVEKMLSGAVAGLFAQSFTYPLEVTRRRMQTIGLVQGNFTEQVCRMASPRITSAAKSNISSNLKSSSPGGPKSMTHTMKALYAEQGLRGFYKGLSMNWMKGPIAFSISFTAYDVIKGCIESAALD